jgi:hypothetical protein
MTEFKSSLRSKIIKETVKSFQNQDHYLFLANVTNWSNNGTDTAVSLTDSISDDLQVYNEMISAHKILTSDIFYALKKSTYVSGTIYDKFSHKQNNENSTYFVTKDAGANVYVYICLDNNSNSASTISPSWTETSLGSVKTSDNYIWKLICKFSKIDIATTDNYYGIQPSTATLYSSVAGGTVEQINITKKGKAFPYVINPTLTENLVIAQELDTNNDLVVKINPSTMSISNDLSIYTNYILLVINGTTIEKYYDIDGVTVTNNNMTISVCNQNTDTADVGKKYALLPKIKIKGNGSNLKIYPIIDTDKTIKAVQIVNPGTGYGSLTLEHDTYTFEPVLNYRILGNDFISDLNITEFMVAKQLTPSGDSYAKANSLLYTFGSNGGTVSGGTSFTYNEYPNNEIRQFGIITNSSDSIGGNTYDTFTTSGNNDLSACDILTLRNATTDVASTEENITQFKNDDYVAQINLTTGAIYAYGKVISITYSMNAFSNIKYPKIVVKTLNGSFSTLQGKLYKYNIDTSTTTQSAWYIKGLSTSDVTKYKGKIIYLENVNPFKLTLNQNAEFKVIFSV